MVAWKLFYLLTGGASQPEDEPSIEQVFKSRLAGLLVLTICWAEAPRRLKWIRKDDDWLKWYIESRQPTAYARGVFWQHFRW